MHASFIPQLNNFGSIIISDYLFALEKNLRNTTAEAFKVLQLFEPIH